MSKLVTIHNNRPATDSLTVAETFEKNHADVLRDIRKLGCSEEFRLSNFAESYYLNHQGRRMPRIIMREQGFTLLAMGYTGPEAMKFKEMYISEFERMREQLNAPAVPQSLPEALRLAADLAEQKATLELQAAKDKPKVLFADAVTASKTSILVGDLAKLLKQNGADIGPNRLFGWLRDNGYLITRKGTDYNMPTQRSMELGLFQIKETSITHSDGHITINKTPKVTGKGSQYFINKFLKHIQRETV